MNTGFTVVCLCSLLARFGGATSYEFTKMVEEGDAIPGTSGELFTDLEMPVISGSHIAFGGGSLGGTSGIYLRNLATGALTTVIDSNTAFPGAPGETFATMDSYGIDGDLVAFRASSSDTGVSGIFLRRASGNVVTVATTESIMPATNGNTFNSFDGRNEEGLSVAGSNVVFSGAGTDGIFGVNGIFRSDGTGLTTIAHTGAGSDLGFMASNVLLPSCEGSFASFLAGPYSTGFESGIYRWTGAAYERLFLSGSSLPGGGNLGSYGQHEISEGKVLFSSVINGSPPDGSKDGLFVADGSGLSTFLRSAAIVPGESYSYGRFDRLAFKSGQTLFTANGVGAVNALYSTIGGTSAVPIRRVIQEGDPLDGRTVNFLQIRPGAISGTYMVFYTYDTAFHEAIWLAGITPDIPHITPTWTGTQASLTFATEAEFWYDVECTTDLENHSWEKVATVIGDDTVQNYLHTPEPGWSSLFYRLRIHPPLILP